MRGIKQALGRELFLQLLKGRVQIAHTVHGHGGAVQLVGAVSGVDGNFAHGDDFHAVFRTKAQPHGVSLKHNTSERAALVFQREVVMPGRILLVVTDLPPDSHLRQQGVRVHSSPDIFIQLGDGQYILSHPYTSMAR